MRISIVILFFVTTMFQSYAQLSDFEHINFEKADNLAFIHKGEKLKSLPILAQKLTSGLTTDVEKFRAIYKWVSTNISNDYNFFLKHKNKTYRFKDDSLKLEYWNERFKKKMFKKLLKRKKTICTGYAYMVRELSRLADLNCQIVNGFGRLSTTDIDTFHIPNHSWNAVRLNGKWYLSDPTWASGLISPNGRFKFNYNDGFFLTPPELFVKNHYPLDKKWMLINEDEAPSFDAFLETPVIYGNAYKRLILHDVPQKLHNIIAENEKIIFKYQLLKPIDINQISLLIDNGFDVKTIKPRIQLKENNILILEYKFDRIGFYDVHFSIGNDLISTYTFKVRKKITTKESSI